MHHDYIMRMIQQMTTFITRVLRLRKEGEYEEALSEITQAYGRLTGIPSSLVHGLDEEALIVMLSARGKLSADQCIALAALLREEAVTWDELDNFDEAYPRYVKAIRLYLEALAGESDLASEDIPGLDESIRQISGYDVSPALRQMLLPYLESTGQFDQAENVLISWEETSDSDSEASAALDEFYERMLRHPDAKLIVGGITRSEVEHALSARRDTEMR